MAPDFFDRFSRGSTICHRLPATWKLGLTLAVIVIAVSLPFSLWPIHGCLACLVFVGHSLARIPVGYLVRRVAWLLPFVLGLAASVALSRSSVASAATAWSIAGAIIVRSSLAFLAALWLVHVTPFDELLATLRRLHVPVLLISLMSFLYRYSFVLLDELDKMRTARKARSFGAAGWRSRWKTNGQLVGSLLIRALDRGERVHGAMCARGWNGEARYVPIRFDQK
jgi:cobalt/nickel transport system permease protein